MFNGGIFTPKGGGSAKLVTFDGNRAIKSVPAIGFNPGTENIKDFLEKAFYKFIQAAITLNSGTTYHEIGTTQSIALSGTITANDEATFSNAKIEVSDGSTLALTSQAGAYSINDTGVVADCDYTAKVTGAGDGGYTVASAKKYIKFIYASFFGKNTTGTTPTAAEIKAGTKRIVLTNSEFTNNPNTSGSEYGWFAVPHTQTSKIYTAWYVTALNNGSIGAGQFIKSPVIVNIDGVDYDVYVYAYASELNANLKLS